METHDERPGRKNFLYILEEAGNTEFKWGMHKDSILRAVVRRTCLWTLVVKGAVKLKRESLLDLVGMEVPFSEKGTGRCALVITTTDLEGTMRIACMLWNSGLTLYPCRLAGGVMDICWAWRRPMTGSSESPVWSTAGEWVNRLLL